MEFVIVWLVCGGIAAMIASSKGGSGPIGFVVGLLFGPFGIIAAFFMGNEQKADAAKIAAGDSKKCPRCAELVKPDALVCKHCGHEFQAPKTKA
ncbi:zinc ribbon domain-containing protein [Sphingobium scionense]|uniref:Membrane protease subunit (Stomatin/prohibitin family) n=1 Tax=Sphingobium scionense TaxID=1404341 RepID=A0A7W6LRD5_9SPHN|nr:zinc ribbon domain-containing protein [Sphingobium scionense]MBB4149105.1 membrane protease subunit (stomatin/prohibitin family) [Sphingobium scionense]